MSVLADLDKGRCDNPIINVPSDHNLANYSRYMLGMMQTVNSHDARAHAIPFLADSRLNSVITPKILQKTRPLWALTLPTHSSP